MGIWNRFAGSDTTAIAMRACFYYLMKNLEFYRQVQAEVDGAASSGLLSSPVRYTEASKLPLLYTRVKEAMRLHPSVGLTLPRVVPAGGMEIAGTYIPAGWWVGMNAAVVGYNKEVYGDDAGGFRPTRWLEEDTAKMDRSMLVFGAGTRMCIGKNVRYSLSPFSFGLLKFFLTQCCVPQFPDLTQRDIQVAPGGDSTV